MKVLRIVPNVAAADIEATKAFYRDLFDLDIIMDLGWIATLAPSATMTAQLSVASEGGSGTPVPAISIEVDDVEEAYARARNGGHEIVYGITDEAWGVRRFYIRDPAGTLVNVLAHKPAS